MEKISWSAGNSRWLALVTAGGARRIDVGERTCALRQSLAAVPVGAALGLEQSDARAATPRPSPSFAAGARARLARVMASTGEEAIQSVVDRRRRARVAVIGAGAAGLAAARELTREGHDAVVFEQGAELGGVWVFDADVEDDLTGADANRAKRVHSSVYKNLRTNLPREVMGFGSFPFTRAFTDDNRRFCGHEEVRAYLDAYADHHDIRKRVRLGTRVVAVTPTSENTENASRETSPRARRTRTSARTWKWGPRWCVVTEPVRRRGKKKKKRRGKTAKRASANAVRPPPRARRAAMMDRRVMSRTRRSTPSSCVTATTPSRVCHDSPARSIGLVCRCTRTTTANPRGPARFRSGETSRGARRGGVGEDLSREIASVAAEVILASRGFAPPKDASSGDFPLDSYPRNMRRAPGITALLPETSGVLFEDGSARRDVDVVLYATGYRVTFPFFASLDGEEEQEEQASASDSESRLAPRSVDNRVAPLFEHVFPPASGPSLSFIGLPWKVVPFPQFEAQARWVARALSGAAALPGRAEMASRAAAAEAADRGAGVADRHAHRMGTRSSRTTTGSWRTAASQVSRSGARRCTRRRAPENARSRRRTGTDRTNRGATRRRSRRRARKRPRWSSRGAQCRRRVSRVDMGVVKSRFARSRASRTRRLRAPRTVAAHARFVAPRARPRSEPVARTACPRRRRASRSRS